MVTKQRAASRFSPVLHGARLAVTRWCTPTLSPASSPDKVLVDGANVGVRLDDGRVLVGRVTRALGAGRSVALQLWGHDEATRIPRSSVVGACLLREHSWADRQAVVERQRRGEPALIVSAHRRSLDADE